jgi:hypothetical protein
LPPAEEVAVNVSMSTRAQVVSCALFAAWHFQENWENRRVPANNFSKEQSLQSMEKVAALLAASKAELWINHDKAQSAGIPKSPKYVE